MAAKIGVDGVHASLANDASGVTGAIVTLSGGSDIDTLDRGRRDAIGQCNRMQVCRSGNRCASSE